MEKLPEQNDIELLNIEMLLRMRELDNSKFNESDIDEFFNQIEAIQKKIDLHSNLNKTNTVSNKFTNKNTLLMYYNNIRSIDNKENIYFNQD